MMCNFMVDHRYIDGGKTVGLVPLFRKVFDSPELYMDVTMKKKKWCSFDLLFMKIDRL